MLKVSPYVFMILTEMDHADYEMAAYFAFMDLALVGVSYALVWTDKLRRREKAGLAMLAFLGVM